MKPIYLGTASILLASLVGACQPKNEASEDAGLAITSALVAGTDAEGVRYTLTPVDCGSGTPTGPDIVVERAVEDQVIPGGLAAFADNPLDEDSEHAFADMFQLVAPGCYDVVAQPITENGEDSVVCAPANKDGVVVNEGETTEVFMISQCQGHDPGAVDAVLAFNHEPELIAAWFADSKFSCGEAVDFCATAIDVENDPLEFELVQLGGPSCTITPGVSEGDASVDGITQCWTVECDEAGKAELSVRAYDQLWDGGSLVRVEDWLAAQGYPNESHTELDLPAYFDGVTLYPDADGDGYGDPAGEPLLSCDDVPGYAANDLDCDDTDPSVHPGAAEVCEDGVDNDCDGADAECPCAPPGPVDLVLLQDLSGSFGDDVATVRTLVPGLHAAVNECVDAAAFGVSSFVDKPFAPYGGAGDYSYQFEQMLDPSLMSLQSTIDGLVVRWGADAAESQLTGLMHTASDAGFAWTAGSRRVIVLMTDAPFHDAGDCPAPPCTAGPNDGDATMNELEDYPSSAQVAAAVNAIGAEVVFAVTAGNEPTYAGFLASSGIDGRVVTLNPDSSNIVDAVLEGLECDCE